MREKKEHLREAQGEKGTLKRESKYLREKKKREICPTEKVNILERKIKGDYFR